LLLSGRADRERHGTTIQQHHGGQLSRQRAEELTKIKTDLQNKFQEALKAIDAKIETGFRI